MEGNARGGWRWLRRGCGGCLSFFFGLSAAALVGFTGRFDLVLAALGVLFLTLLAVKLRSRRRRRERRHRNALRSVFISTLLVIALLFAAEARYNNKLFAHPMDRIGDTAKEFLGEIGGFFEDGIASALVTMEDALKGDGEEEPNGSDDAPSEAPALAQDEQVPSEEVTPEPTSRWH